MACENCITGTLHCLQATTPLELSTAHRQSHHWNPPLPKGSYTTGIFLCLQAATLLKNTLFPAMVYSLPNLWKKSHESYHVPVDLTKLPATSRGKAVIQRS